MIAAFRAKGWQVAIIPLSGSKSQPPTLILRNQSISTSGDLEQFLEIDGRRYSHIVDARTGIGSTNQAMATVVAPRGIDADRLTKTGLLLPWEKAVGIVSRRPGTHLRVVAPGNSGEVKERLGPEFPKPDRMGGAR